MKQISILQRMLRYRFFFVALFVLLAGGVGYSISIKTSDAATPTMATLGTDVNTAITYFTTASNEMTTAHANLDTAIKRNIAFIAGQGLSTVGSLASNLDSPASLNLGVAEGLVLDALNQAVASGTVSLTNVSNVGLIPEDSLKALASSAVADGLVTGSVKLDQLTNLDLASSADIANLVSIAVQQGRINGAIDLTKTQSAGNISGKFQSIVNSAIHEAVTGGTTIDPTVRLQIENAAVATLKGVSGSIDLATLKSVIANQIVSTTGTGDATTIAGLMNGSSVNQFKDAVQGVVITNAIGQVSAMTGTVNLGMIQNTIASSVVMSTGLGSIGPISGSFGGITTSNFTDMVKSAVINDAVDRISSFSVSTDLPGMQNMLANLFVDSTGQGSVSSIISSFTAQTTNSFTGSVQSMLTEGTASALTSINSSLDISGIKNLMASQFASLSGSGSVSSIASSLTNIDTTSIASAIKDSVVQNSFESLGSISNLNYATVETLLSNQIKSLTGALNTSAMKTAMSNGFSSAVAGIASTKSASTALLDGINAQLSSLTELSSQLSSGLINTLSASALSDLATNLASLQTSIVGMIGNIGGPINSAISSISSISSSAISSGVLSSVDLSSITSSVSSITSLTGPLSTSMTSITGDAASVAKLTGTSVPSVSSSVNTKPFGGFSLAVIYCSCTKNYAVYFKDLTKPTPIPPNGPLIYQPGFTKLYQFFQITRPGVWILGNWQQGGSCYIKVKKKCRKVQTYGIMTIVGTSK